MARPLAVLRTLEDRPAFLSLVLAAALIATLCLALDPRWETNDDVSMSMIAQGYGLAAYASPKLVFSNVLWGYLVRSLPTINGVLGYSLATVGVLFSVGWAMLYFLLRLGAGRLLGALALALLIARPTLFPQFTVNAGLLTVAAVIGWQVYARYGGLGSLVVACLLAFFGYLIRDQEFFLVLGVALPFLPWRVLRERRQMKIAVLLLAMAMASAAAFDHWSYTGPEWQQFLELDPVRASFTDFGAGQHLKQYPEILARGQYSQNDVDLIRAWFYVDPQIANPKALTAMLVASGWPPILKDYGQSGFAAIASLFNPVLLPMLCAALVLFALIPRWSAAIAWAFGLAALFALGAAGRPGILRVYVPLVSLLLVMPLAIGRASGVKRWTAALAVLAACAGNAYLLVPEAIASKHMARQAQRDVASLPAEPIVAWGGEFPYEFALQVLSTDPRQRDIRLYALDALTLAPYSVGSAEEIAGTGLVDRLRSPAGLSIIAPQRKIDMLAIFCREHLNGQFREIATYKRPSLTMRQVRCGAAG